jgi:hypothetical protein
MKPGESKYTSTLPSAQEGHQWLTRSCQINSGKEPQYPFKKSWVCPRAIQNVLEKRKILVPTRIQTLDHPTSGADAILTKLQQGQEGMALANLPLVRNTLPIVQEARWPHGQSEQVQKI